MKIVGITVLIALVLLGGYWYSHYRATQAANDGETISPDNSVTTSLAPPDSTPAPAPVNKSAMPGSTSVSTPSKPVITTQTSLKADPDAGSLPASDTIDRQPPNGMVFAGTGKIQVYRQGNITWRINTDTGAACVLFATNREWRKPQVYNNGCRKS